MTIVIEYRSYADGLFSTVSRDKYCSDYIARVMQAGTDGTVNLCDVVLNRRYTTLRGARQAIARAVKNSRGRV